MNERREPPGDGPRPRAIPAGVGRLSPVQEAWSAYVGHSLNLCNHCRTPSAGRCDEAETLYQAWRALDADAYRRMYGET